MGRLQEKVEAIVMSQTIQEKNKALVLEAFDTLYAGGAPLRQAHRPD